MRGEVGRKTGRYSSCLTAAPWFAGYQRALAYPGRINHVEKLAQEAERGLLDFQVEESIVK
jgi:hypothetical protein